MTDECILCYEPVSIYAIGKCNHNPICHLCSIKSRNILKNKYCSICKVKLKYLKQHISQNILKNMKNCTKSLKFTIYNKKILS